MECHVVHALVIGAFDDVDFTTVRPVGTEGPAIEISIRQIPDFRGRGRPALTKRAMYHSLLAYVRDQSQPACGYMIFCLIVEHYFCHFLKLHWSGQHPYKQGHWC